MKKAIFAIVYCILAAAFTVYVVLTTFFVKSTPDININISAALTKTPTPTLTPTPTPEILAVPTNVPVEDPDLKPTLTPTSTPTPTPTMAPVWTENSYTDSNMAVTITKYREYNSDIFVVDVVLNSVDLLKTQLASVVRGGNWEVVSDISKACDNLILSINGDCWASRNGYSIKNGVLIRDSITKYTKTLTSEEPGQEDYVIFSDGTAKVIKEGEVTAEELIEMGAWQLFNFGPALIEDHKNVSRTSVSTSNVAKETAPRTAIGVMDDLHYVFIVVDGRSWTQKLNFMNKGVTCYQLADFAMKLGVESLYNLDGGGSSTLYFNGEVINNPCRNGKKIEEQTVSDIIYVGY
ncbi:MAG: phosphodiester glycosidase family protein [Lachnospiraceae bacterium]|nr:phosphodiester glycosidase family protein [Lachnospiraceae bacterium]